MHTQVIKLIDPSCTVVASAQVVEQGEEFIGWVNLAPMPSSLLRKFVEYEEIVNGQMFSLLDEIEEQIGATLLKIRFDTGRDVAIDDLQIYPRTGRISFKLASEMALSDLRESVA